MKRVTAVLIVLLFTLGCGVFTQYSKEVTVTKDGNGKVTSVVITEKVVQPDGVAAPMVLEYIKLVPVNARGNTPTPIELPKK